MTTWKLVKLNFERCSAHFGELGIGMESTTERVHSDTLFSAWMSAYARLYPDQIDALLKRFRDESSPPMRVSSTFIYRTTDKSTIYYLPRPLKFPINYPKDNDLEFFKTYKKLNYLPLKVWQRWYQGIGFTSADRDALIAKTNGLKGGQLENESTFNYKQAFEIQKIPKIAVDRTTQATNLYHTAFVQFQWQQNGNNIQSLSGLYFLLEFPEYNAELSTHLETALELLGDEGLGGERSSGAGRFKVEWQDLPSDWKKVVEYPEEPTHYYLISLFWDDDQSELEKLITKKSSYEIRERGGWIIQSNIRRQMVRMFTEGSVFPAKPNGKLIDVTPRELITSDGKYKTHPIYRSGISLNLPIKAQNS
ncbi:type III-A CRISPR-associated RAMP protein Csm4 [Aetokthonos hydrillicola Thurmond2011]|jgi:CRISPR-associated protein Csm4|uniref:CRISPR system Cms protein Csm4 n=1 Tax=Aetokthonos hydrillicola Thurmond2011 TaxID=2712845 RepID=A0AAP5I273_9CYAN|nr:type III-A CRISPR-associated RAMP protein Csm4 [Aetokthonos hydrillicola]MBW4590197.1 type III-A CRISPR-associated RAMP protein Csm4 [Aetokthonos hydrillicola CCALA 1050]MDR9893341.1 type III-A CRISPR-associated RAMP protein Csm4 [Aetokthonos hydrillicola Thurmond2011]